MPQESVGQVERLGHVLCMAIARMTAIDEAMTENGKGIAGEDALAGSLTEAEQEVARLETRIALTPAETLGDAMVQLRVLAGLLHCGDAEPVGHVKNTGILKDLLLESITTAVGRAAHVGANDHCARYYSAAEPVAVRSAAG